MNKLLRILLVFLVIGICTGCNNGRGNPGKNQIPAGTYDHSELKFSAGDIISCDMYTPLYPSSHILLAITEKLVIHITGSYSDSPFNGTRIVEKNFSEVGSAFGKCKVIIEFYDQTYASTCGGKPFNTTEIVRRADVSRNDFRGKVTHYDVYRCNCEHWVSAWRYGVAWTLQVPKRIYSTFRSDKCEAPGTQRCP